MNQIYIGNFSKGLKKDRTQFNIDNDAFTYLFNTYVWRGRVKRKRGTVKLGRLTRQISIVTSASNPWEFPPLNSNNLITGLGLESTSSLVPGSLNITGSGGQLWTDLNMDGTLQGSIGGIGTVNYSTGEITGPTPPNTGTFSYYPGLPVMGLRDFVTSVTITSNNYPLLIAFDTTYAYQCDQEAIDTNFFSVSYYKNTNIPVIWNGQDYQQFWSTNYPTSTTNQTGAFWATNNVPGFHFANGTYTSGSGTTTITMNLKSGGNNLTTLIDGDKLWMNEWTGNINGNVGEVTDDTDSANGNYVITFSSSVTVSGTGIAELLTNSIDGIDGIRWYDGDMTGQTGIPTSSSTGWVNFSPPLTQTTVSINGLPSALYYLVGCLAVLPFKDRLLFFSPYVQAVGGNPIQLNDTVIWSWNGTPFYNSLVPNNQTFKSSAYYVDQTGLGGILSAGISQPIQTITNNEDVLLIGFGGNGRKTRFAYTGNDIQPFLFYNINSELPSTSTFSSVVLDKGAIDIGSFGICITDQQNAQRIDLDIPDEVFRIQKNNNGNQRVNAIRDFINEWIYFTYPVDNSDWKFPTQSFLLNYRDNTWSVLYENFTCHGNYRANDTVTWATLPYDTWGEWADPWNTGTETEYEIQVIAGNPQGYVLIKGIGTTEGFSGYISGISDDGNGNTKITSYNHCLTDDNPNTFTSDFIFINGCLGSDASNLNNRSYSIINVIDEDNFVINFAYPGPIYFGNGQFKRLSHPVLKTKQFPMYWEAGRQVRLGRQQYLLTKTADGEVTLNIYLSQDDTDPWNNPDFAGTPNGLVYSQTLFTKLEPNNLQAMVGEGQKQIWHRVNTSLIGDTFQIGITLSDEQMLNFNIATDEIILHGMNFTIAPGPLLS